MGSYIRQEQDVFFRRVSLYSSQVMDFQEFALPDQNISWDENKFVLEVQHEDGSSEIIGRSMPVEAEYQIGNGQLKIYGKIPTARISIGYPDNPYVKYRIPQDENSNSYDLQVSMGAELYGDDYFSAAFILKRV